MFMDLKVDAQRNNQFLAPAPFYTAQFPDTPILAVWKFWSSFVGEDHVLVAWESFFSDMCFDIHNV